MSVQFENLKICENDTFLLENHIFVHMYLLNICYMRICIHLHAVYFERHKNDGG